MFTSTTLPFESRSGSPLFMKRFFMYCVCAVLLFTCTHASAQVIDLRTGVNGSGLIAVGSTDDTWTVKVPGSTTYQPAYCGTGVATGPIIPMVYLTGLDPSVRWITPLIDGIGDHLYDAPMGNYYYKMTFDFSRECLATEATFNLNLAGADDQITHVIVNGNSYLVAYGFNPFSTNITLPINPANIHPGANEIIFRVWNYGNISEPYSPTGMEINGNLTIVTGPDASFCMSTPTSSSMSLTANSPGGGHQWEIYSSPNGSPGSYTYMGMETGSSVNYSGAGPCWLVKHALTNDCGFACVAQSACYQSCETPISYGCSELTPPTNLVYDAATGVLSWTPVSGAVSYTIQLIINDATCCNPDPGSLGVVFTVSATGNSYILNAAALTALGVLTTPNCFSWQVTAICSGGATARSEKKCAFPPSKSIKGPMAKVAPTGIKDPKTEKATMNMYPNPVKGFVMIDLSVKNDVTFNVTITDISGKVVKTFENLKTKDAKQSVKWNTESVSKGAYLVKIQTSDNQVIHNKLIVE
ncbi:MAG: T9SS type A sorting domain-containing protein [Bacteroidota bacterium]